jgi:hypothetical protein
MIAVGLWAASVANATTMILQDTRTLVRGSNDIVVGKVASVRSRWDEGHRHIVTDVEVEVSESLKGAKQRLTLTQLGGEVDGMRLTVPGCPVFEPGEEALLFVWRDTRGRAQLNGLGQGKFEIRRDPKGRGRLVERALPGLGIGDARSLRALREGESPARVTLESMLQEIRNELAKSDR